MMFTSHFETSINRTAHALTALISDLGRTVRYFDLDIEVEETRAGIFDVQNPKYPASLEVYELAETTCLPRSQSWRQPNAFMKGLTRKLFLE